MKITIVTINRNNAEGLRKTMASVFKQTYRDFEYIVVDGASTDDSVKVIREYESANSLSTHSLNFTWISERDTGIYNAMNKGIEIASGLRVVDALNRSTLCGDKNKGNNRSELVEDKHGEANRPEGSGVENKVVEDEYVLMLNSGDYLVDDHVIERIIPELDGADIIQGNNIENHGEKVYRYKGYAHSEIDFFDVMRGKFLHQASFCKKELFEKYGYFDESYKISGDTKFFMNCLGVHSASFKYIDVDIVNYDCSGISASTSGKWYEQGKQEQKRLRNELFSKRLQEHFEQNDKKIRLYDALHQHRWIWYLTMGVAHIYMWVYGAYPPDVKRERLK